MDAPFVEDAHAKGRIVTARATLIAGEATGDAVADGKTIVAAAELFAGDATARRNAT